MATSKYRVRLTRLGRHMTPESLEVSCGVLDIMLGNVVLHRIVVDCGITPFVNAAGEKVDSTPDLTFFEDGIPINVVVLTHMHLDHAGAAPLLKRFMAHDARVYVSKMSLAMMPTVLMETISIAEKNGRKPLYDMDTYVAFMNRVVPITRAGEIELFPGIPTYFHPAGHMPGAFSFTVRLGKVHVHYAGDRCTHDQPGTLGATPIPAEWRTNCIVAGCDCTYGADPASDTRNREDELKKLISMATQTMSDGGIALIHTFATRGLSLAAELQRMGLPKTGQVLMDGSTRVYADIIGQREFQWCDRDSTPHIGDVGRIEPMTRSEVMGRTPHAKEKAAEYHHRRMLMDGTEGFAIAATPGMGGPGGVTTAWRPEVLEDERAAMIYTGFVAPDSDGALVLAAAKRRETDGHATVTFREQEMARERVNGSWHKVTREVGGKQVPVFREVTKTFELKCKVLQVRLGAHESRSGILNWFQEEMQPMAAVLNHGSPAALASLEADLRGMHGLQGLYRADVQPAVEFDL